MNWIDDHPISTIAIFIFIILCPIFVYFTYCAKYPCKIFGPSVYHAPIYVNSGKGLLMPVGGGTYSDCLSR